MKFRISNPSLGSFLVGLFAALLVSDTMETKSVEIIRLGIELTSSSSAHAVVPEMEDLQAKEHATGPLEEDSEAHRKQHAWAFYGCLVVLVVVTLSFAFVKDELIARNKGTRFSILVDSMFSELTVMGGVGVVIFVVDKIGILTAVSEGIYHPEASDSPEVMLEKRSVIREVFEMLHMLIFLMMVCYIGEVTILLRAALGEEHEWQNAEEKLNHPKEVFKELHTVYNLPEDYWWAGIVDWFYRSRSSSRSIDYLAIREEFMLPRDKRTNRRLPSDFQFYDYLGHATGVTLSRLIHISMSAWLIMLGTGLFMVLLLIKMRAQMWILVTMLLSFASLLCICNFFFSSKISHICKQLTSRAKLHSRLIEAILLSKIDRNHDKRVSRNEWVQAIGDDEIFTQMFDSLDEDKDGIVSFSEMANERNVIAHRMSLQENKPLTRTLTANTLPPAFQLSHSESEEMHWYQFWSDNDKAANEHERLFWGQRKGPGRAELFIQLNLVFVGTYLPALVFIFAGWAKAPADSPELTLTQFLCLLPVFVFPPFFILRQVQLLLGEFIIVTHIESLVNPEILMKCKVEQQAAKVTKIMSLIIEMQSLVGIIRSLNMHEGNEGNEDEGNEGNEGKVDDDSVYKAALATIDKEKMTHFINMFEYFDKDGSGVMDKDEIEPFLNSLGIPDPSVTRKALLQVLDKDKTGTISKDEFVRWLVIQEAANTSPEATIQQKAQQMFDFFDTSKDKTVKADELVTKLKDFGYELAEGDVDLILNILDEDNTGNVTVTDIEAMLRKVEPD